MGVASFTARGRLGQETGCEGTSWQSDTCVAPPRPAGGAGGGFSFDDAACCPCAVEWARASALGPAGLPGVDEVRAFLRSCGAADSR